MKLTVLGRTELAVAPFCLGMMQFGSQVTGGAIDQLINEYRNAGGNFFDTAHCYCCWLPCGDGTSERLLGDYVQRYGCRDQVVIATKGGHPSMPNYRVVEDYLSAARIGADIDDSLARLRTDRIDLYWLHRDDPRIPAGEIVDILNAEVRRGRIRYFGGSNWTSERLAEANDYADAHGLAGFVASQPRWHLGTAAEEPAGDKRFEPGVLLSLSERDQAWHAQSQLPVIPYSPTGCGFFANNGEKPAGMRTERALSRLAAARQIAVDTGATANQIALAWLRHQPFPVIPILGTSRREHLQDALGAAEITLTAAQMTALSEPKRSGSSAGNSH